MKHRKSGEIDGFWVLLIGIMVVLPAIKYLTGNDKTEELEGQSHSVEAVNEGIVLEIRSNTANAPLNTQMKIPLSEGAVRADKVSPDKGEPEVIKTSSKYAITFFDKRGEWEVNMYDTNNLLVDWIRITVY